MVLRGCCFCGLGWAWGDLLRIRRSMIAVCRGSKEAAKVSSRKLLIRRYWRSLILNSDRVIKPEMAGSM